MRRFLILAPALACAIVAATVLAEDKETADDSQPRLIAVTFHADKSKECTDLEALLAKVRPQFEDKNVLFLTVNVTSRGSRHQGKLLLNALGQGDVWLKHAKKSGTTVLVDTNTGDVTKTFTAKDKDADIVAAITKGLAPPAEDAEGCGCEDGCGGGDEEGCGCDG